MTDPASANAFWRIATQALVPLHRGFDGLPERSFRLPDATARRFSLLRIDRYGWRAAIHHAAKGLIVATSRWIPRCT